MPDNKKSSRLTSRAQSSAPALDADALFAIEGAGQKSKGHTPLAEAEVVDLERIEIVSEEEDDTISNPRDIDLDYFKTDDHRDLTATVAEHGLLMPLLVRAVDWDSEGVTRYQLVAGHRRYYAARDAGLTRVPCIVRSLSDEQVTEIQIIENDQRRDFTERERARGYMRLITRFGYSQRKLAKRTGRSQTDISFILRIHRDETLQEFLQRGDITWEQARELVAEKQESAKRALAEELAAKNKRQEPVEREQLREAVRTSDPTALNRPKPFPTPPFRNGEKPNYNEAPYSPPPFDPANLTTNRATRIAPEEVRPDAITRDEYSRGQQPMQRQISPTDRANRMLANLKHAHALLAGTNAELFNEGGQLLGTLAPELTMDLGHQQERIQKELDKLSIATNKAKPETKLKMVG